MQAGDRKYSRAQTEQPYLRQKRQSKKFDREYLLPLYFVYSIFDLCDSTSLQMRCEARQITSPLPKRAPPPSPTPRGNSLKRLWASTFFRYQNHGTNFWLPPWLPQVRAQPQTCKKDTPRPSMRQKHLQRLFHSVSFFSPPILNINSAV